MIGGYTLTEKKTSGVSSLLLGVYEGGELVYVGRAGTGLSESDRKELEGKFVGLQGSMLGRDSFGWLYVVKFNYN